MSMADYQKLYQSKSHQYEQLAEQYAQLQEQTNLIINDLQEQLKQAKHKNQLLSREINQQKEKSKCFKSSIEREVELAQKERNQFKKKFIQFQKKVIQLQIVNQNLQSQLRSTKYRLAEYQSQTQKTMQELAFAQLQLEETHQSNKETVARLRGQLKEAEEELYVLQQNRQYKKEQPHIPSQVTVSESTANKHIFRQTLKGIREYMADIEGRKAEAKRTILKINS